MTLEQKQETLQVAYTEMQNFLRNANISNEETGTQLILDSIVLVPENFTTSQEVKDYHKEQQDLVFDVINNVGFEDEDNITVEELDEILLEIENALADLKQPETTEEKTEAINIAIAELNEYFENGDHEATNEIKQYWINEDNTYDADLFRGHYFNVTNSELTEGQQHYIWDLIESASCFENETIDHDLIDFIPTMLNNELVELEPA